VKPLIVGHTRYRRQQLALRDVAGQLVFLVHDLKEVGVSSGAKIADDIQDEPRLIGQRGGFELVALDSMFDPEPLNLGYER